MNFAMPQLGRSWDEWRMAKSSLFQVCKKGFDQSLSVPLPGEDYERFELSTGDFTEWKSVSVPIGKAVMFRANGACSMPLHSHESPEILHLLSGKLAIVVEAETTILNPGESHVTKAGKAHSAYYIEPGECFCHWPALESDRMTIDVLA